MEFQVALGGKVVRLIPNAAYRDVVVDQMVIVIVETGQEIVVFDYDMKVGSVDVGRTLILDLSAFMPDIESVDPEYGVKGWVPEVESGPCTLGDISAASDSYGQEVFARRKRELGVSGILNNRAFTGRVLGFQDSENFLLDVGCGTIRVHHDPRRLEVKPGRFIRIGDFRLDLKEVSVSRLSNA